MIDIKDIIHNIKHPLFLSTLIIFLIAYPQLHQQYPDHIVIVEVFFGLLMVSGVTLLTGHKKILICMMLLVFFILIGILVSGYVKNKALLLSVLFVEFIFFLVIFICLVNHIYGQKKVTLNKLYAAVTSYLVLGIIFAVLYTFITIIFPGTFQYTLANTLPYLKIFPHPQFFSEALYFSFVTLGTLGYGDWVPILGPVKMVASLEAIFGQLYIAILIARLVGIQIAQSLSKS